jgi:hypothetical protein
MFNPQQEEFCMHSLPDRSGPLPSPAICLTILAVLIPILIAVNVFAGAFKVGGGGGGSSTPDPATMNASQQTAWATTLHTQLQACLGEEMMMIQAIPTAMDAAMAKAQAGDLTNYGLNPVYGQNLKKVCDPNLVGPMPTDLAPGAVGPAKTLEQEWHSTLATAIKLQAIYITPMADWNALMTSMLPS